MAGENVTIRKSGQALIIEPAGEDEWAWLGHLPRLDPDFMADGRDATEQQRTELDKLFR